MHTLCISNLCNCFKQNVKRNLGGYMKNFLNFSMLTLLLASSTSVFAISESTKANCPLVNSTGRKMANFNKLPAKKALSAKIVKR